MAYAGYLIKLKAANGAAAVNLPFKFIRAESYSCTPDQRMEAKANRAVTGKLVRTTVEHTASKIEFETPYLTNAERAELNKLFKDRFISDLERSISMEYYDDETDTYKDGTMYMPDVQYNIYRVDNTNNVIYYNPVRYAFIEY